MVTFTIFELKHGATGQRGFSELIFLYLTKGVFCAIIIMLHWRTLENQQMFSLTSL